MVNDPLLDQVFVALEESDFFVQDHKKIIETVFSKLSKKIKSSKKIDIPKFKQLDYDTTQLKMSDFVFKNRDGKALRWRVLGNVWGDEIVPIAIALKSTGHDDITYIGTAGATPEKCYKVGDVVIPGFIRATGSAKKVQGPFLAVEGAKKGGIVEHVGSPFEETNEWLDNVKSRSDFVEVETSYLAKIFKSKTDKISYYLLISDILGSDGEDLARSSSSKRRKALNSILKAVFNRDQASYALPIQLNRSNQLMNLRSKVQELYSNRGKVFQHFIISNIEQLDVTKKSIQSFVDSTIVFSDEFFSQRIVISSEILSYIIKDIALDLPIPEIGLSRDFLHGKYNPKTDKIKIQIYAANLKILEEYKKRIDKYAGPIAEISDWAEFEVIRGPPGEGIVTSRPSIRIDSDYLLKLYTRASYMSSGLDYDVTYNGKLKYHFLPTEKMLPICKTSKRFCSLAYYTGSEKTQELLEKIREIEKFDHRKSLDNTIKRINKMLEVMNRSLDFASTVELKIIGTLPDGHLAQIIPVFDEKKGLIIQLQMTEESLNNPLIVAEEIAHLMQIIDSQSFFSHPAHWAEISFNAKNGSKRSQLILAQTELDAVFIMRRILGAENISQEVGEYLSSRTSDAELLIQNLKIEVAEENRSRKKITQRYKTLMSDLEKADKKLDDYIEANDRAGVRKLIESFMPWEEMEPTEISVWSRWLDALKKPTKSHVGKKLLFRGIGADDVIKKTSDGQRYIMSKLLTKNQGNYTRRLRSLRTYHKKIYSEYDAKLNRLRSFTLALRGHAKDPVASPFISTSFLDKAKTFMGHTRENTIAAIYIHEDRIIENLVSIYNEKEIIIPLIVFPDEIIGIAPYHKIYDVVDYEAFKKEVEEKIGRPIEAEELKYVERKQESKVSILKKWWDRISQRRAEEVKGGRCQDALKIFID